MIKTCEKVDELECAAAACSGGKFVHVQAKAKCVVRDLLDFYKMDSGDTAAAIVPEAKFTANYHRFMKGEGKWNEYFLKHGVFPEAGGAAAKSLLQGAKDSLKLGAAAKDPAAPETKRSKPTTRAALERDGRKHDGLLRSLQAS